MKRAREVVRLGAGSLLAAAVFAGGRAPAADEAPAPEWNPSTQAFAERAFVVPYPRVTPQGSWIISIDHRANEPLARHPFDDLLGLDAGSLTIGLGARYGLLDNLDLGFKRYNAATTLYNTYQFDGRLQLWREGDRPADVTLGGGLTWFQSGKAPDEVGGMGELLAGRSLWPRLYVTTGALFQSRPAELTDPADVDHYTLAVLATLHWRVLDRLALVTEWSIPVAGAWEGAPAWSVGPKYFTPGHSFSVVVSNLHSLSNDRLAAGSDRWGDPIIGFTITRQL